MTAIVGPRSLRHYHALGLLPEPSRQANGYREYGALDVARLLRIKRLAALGPLMDCLESANWDDSVDDAR